MMRLMLALVAFLVQPVAAQELRGHGGPVRALAVSPDGNTAISGSFDTSAILWDLMGSQALSVLRGHEGSVNAVAAFEADRFATGGEDGRVLLWRRGRPEAEGRLESHSGPIASLSSSSDGKLLASASWDGTARVTTLASGAAVVISGHRGPVNAIAFASDGRSVVTAGHDGTVRITPLDGGAARSIDVSQPVAGLAVAPDGEIIAGGADGRLIFLAADGARVAEMVAAETPIVALTLSANGKRIAAAGIRGAVAIIDRASRRVERVLVGPGLPIWSLAFRASSDELLTGGGDSIVHRWNAATGQHLGPVVMARPSAVPARFADHPGAAVFRACSACHTLGPDDGNRAGPTLYGVIGRRIATAPGYEYSAALRNMTIVWSKETIARLFEAGPNAYTPGTKMPEQRVVDPDDRKALVDFIAKATGAE